MKISSNNFDGIQVWQNKGVSSGKAEENKKIDIPKDTISFSEKAKKAALHSIASETVKSVEKGADTEKLLNLRTQVANGLYYVSSEDIASKIVKP